MHIHFYTHCHTPHTHPYYHHHFHWYCCCDCDFDCDGVNSKFQFSCHVVVCCCCMWITLWRVLVFCMVVYMVCVVIRVFCGFGDAVFLPHGCLPQTSRCTPYTYTHTQTYTHTPLVLFLRLHYLLHSLHTLLFCVYLMRAGILSVCIHVCMYVCVWVCEGCDSPHVAWFHSNQRRHLSSPRYIYL